MSDTWMNWLHDWQVKAFNEVITHLNRTEKHNPIMVNASVGSGKTAVAALALADFIDEHRNERTIQAFITPRIKLCSQQYKELTSVIQNCTDKFDYQNFEKFPDESPYQVIQVDCTNKDFSKQNPNLTAKHVIFVICEASLWGTDNNEPEKRWNGWKHLFDVWQNEGYVFGNMVFDEAHNYANNDKVEKMFGQTTFTKKVGIAYEGKRCLMNWFQNIMLLSGTPAAYQCALSTAFSKNVCECPVNVAINNGWVCRPILNLVNIDYESEAKIYSNAIYQTLKYEENIIKPANGVRLLVNYSSIDEIDKFLKDEYIKNHIGKEFHFITIHSAKNFKNDDLTSYKRISQIDGVEYSSGDVYDLLESIDSGVIENPDLQKMMNQILDGKPIVVGQVAMIGEGINIKSFNSVITKTNSDVEAMQQIGRVLRKYKGKTNPNIYCVFDNQISLRLLLSNLILQRSLTADCFDWGKRMTIKNGSTPDRDVDDKDKASTASSIEWYDIDPNLDPDIQELQYSPEFQNTKMSRDMKKFTESEEFDNLLKKFEKAFSTEVLINLVKVLKKNNAGMTKVVAKKASRKPGKKKEKLSNASPVNENENVKVSAGTITQEIENDLAPIQSVIFEIIRPIRDFVLRHATDEMVMKNAKDHLDYLAESLLSYFPDEARKSICSSGIFTDEDFLEIVNLK